MVDIEQGKSFIYFFLLKKQIHMDSTLSKNHLLKANLRVHKIDEIYKMIAT